MSGLKQILTDYCARHSLRFQLNTVQSQSGSEWQALATVSDFLREVHFESSAAVCSAVMPSVFHAPQPSQLRLLIMHPRRSKPQQMLLLVPWLPA